MAETKCKYYKQKRQVSYDGGATWQDVIPYEYQKGDLYEYESADCGSLVVYRWINMDSSVDYYCEGTTKYYKQKRQVSYDGGVTWRDVTPAEYQRGGVAEQQSTDCGYVPPVAQYRWIKSDDTICVETPTPHPLVEQYLTVVPLTSGTIAKIGHREDYQYSTDSGSTWINATSATSISLTTGNKIMFKGTITPTAYQASGRFSASTGTQFDVEGNVMSLLYGDDYSGKTSLSGKTYAFSSLFLGCNGLVSAALLSLPATVLSNSCYANMFKNCTSLVTPPQLSATSLQTGCYKEMFAGCTSLTSSPKLPATIIGNQSYYGMFNGCTSLNNITCMATNRSAVQCTTNWVNNVAATGTFYKNSSTTWSRGVDAVPTGWEIKDAD